ncbi:TetR/AcrR family transcriptional regulator [Mycobacterium sp. URHB0044]|uniref:TetR/AcrR family transcriptional regulator n=1 Tax=Mycobacterium sp. URHB0044 TaxID=1380386 RepID=UPI000AD3FB3A|nr:TetR/AcrR family transcriptional regulator [Mycobacterium sp. URHB0044]
MFVADAREERRRRGTKAVAPSVDPGDKREQILQAAQKLFAEQGFRETNLNDVAEQLGFRRQAVYHYFKSKDDILYELIWRAGQAVKEGSDAMFGADLAPDVSLPEVIRNHVRQLLSNVDVFRIQFAELGKLSGPRADQLRAEQTDYIRRVADILSAGQKAGLFREVPVIPHALLIIGMCSWTTEWYSEARSQLTIDEVAEYAVQLTMSGIAKR